MTAFASIGGSRRSQQVVSFDHRISDTSGTLLGADTFTFIAADRMDGLAMQGGARADFATGAVDHQAVLSYDRLTREWRRGRFNGFTVPDSNLYSPVFGSGPPDAVVPEPGDAPKTQDVTFSSMALADTASFLGKRIQLTAGARLQRIGTQNFNAATGAVTSDYDEQAITPVAGLVVKPWRNVSLYVNYIESLQQGQTAPTGTANAGEIFAPYVSKQYEAGVKVDFGEVITTFSAFQIAQPSGFIDPASNLFGVDGEQRNRGLEFNALGEPLAGVRLLGGASYFQAELTETAGGVNQGNTAVGVPRMQLIAGAEWDLPFAAGLTLSGRAVHNSSQYLDQANTQKIPDWTQLDIGARYAFAVGESIPVTVRANLTNLLDSAYWSSSGFGQLILSEPRTLSVSATVSF